MRKGLESQTGTITGMTTVNGPMGHFGMLTLDCGAAKPVICRVRDALLSRHLQILAKSAENGGPAEEIWLRGTTRNIDVGGFVIPVFDVFRARRVVPGTEGGVFCDFDVTDRPTTIPRIARSPRPSHHHPTL